MGYIYQIYNDVNNKVYIGQTIKTIEIRWGEHLCNSKTSDNHLYLAMRKYGVEHFFIKYIEECDDKLLDEREIYWIAYYDSYNSGYNETLGGNGNRKYTKEMFLELWNIGLTCKEISESIGCATHTVSSWLKSCNIPHEEIIYRRANRRHKKVYQFDMNENLIQIFDSVLDATEFFEYSSASSLCNAIRFHFNVDDSILVFEEDIKHISKYIEKYYRRQGRKPVLQYKLDGTFVSRYNTIKEAAQAIDGKEAGIINTCKKRFAFYKNYLWKYEDDDTDLQTLIKEYQISVYKKGRGTMKKVDQYDLDGNYLKTYNSIEEARISIGSKTGDGISKCCCGQRRTSGGYIWRYTEQND